MIRPFTLVTMVLAALSGAYLFGVKHRAQVLDDQLASVTQASRLDDQRIAVLQAQWSLEIDHNRLQSLTQKFSGLTAMKPSQLVTLAALSRTLPPPGSAAPEANPLAAAPMPAEPMLAAPMPAASTPAAPGPAAPEPAAPVVVAAGTSSAADEGGALPLPPPEAPVAAAEAAAGGKVILASAAAPRRHAARAAARLAAIKPRFVGTELAENVPVARPVALAPALPVGGKIVAANATVAEDSGQGGSMLGMAADLAPPQPLPGADH